MKRIINWFKKEPTYIFEVIGWWAVSIIYVFVFWVLLTLSGCASFEKTTGYKQNTYWRS